MFSVAAVVSHKLHLLGRPADLTIPEKARTINQVHWIPEGLPGPEHFEISTTTAPSELPPGHVIVELLHISADPYLRSACKSEEKAGSKLPRTVNGFVTGVVLRSNVAEWNSGDLFGALLPFCTVQVVNPAKSMIWKLTDFVTRERLSHGLGPLGMPGSTAYAGLLGILRPREKLKKPEVIWISGAAGAVGSLVGQIAKSVFGCTVIGSCGGSAKCALIKEKFGFDHAVDYKLASSAENLEQAVRKVAPDGIDMYFDNVGGAHFEAAMRLLRAGGRVAVCGGISKYNQASSEPERISATDMIYKCNRVEGFVCAPWLKGERGQFLKDTARWMREGKVHIEETKFQGIESWPIAFQALFTGKNTGKVVVDV